MKNAQILLVVATVVILAGCVQQPAKVGGAGIVITSFSPEVQEVESTSPVLFTASIQNVGDLANTNKINLEIFGLDDWAGDKAAAIDSPLQPADTARGVEGQTAIKDFSLTSPTKDVTVAYTPTLRVSYTYSTKSTIQLKFVTRELVRTNPQEQSTATVTTSGGLFIVSVKGKLSPIQSSTGNVNVPVQIELQNVGGGRAYPAGDPAAAKPTSTSIDNIKVTITSTGATTTCIPTGENVRLVGGKSRIISCTLAFTSIQAAGLATAVLDVALDYNYFVDTAASVTVLKKVA